MRADLADLKCVCDEIARAIKSAESSKIAESSTIFLLQGDIGAGKTTLVKAFAEYVGIKESVTSPTFSLLHIYSNSSCGDFSQSRKARFLDEPFVLSSSLASHNCKNSSTILEFDSCNGFAESSEKIKSKKPLKSFCYFWLLPKVESPLPLNSNLPNNADSANLQNLTIYHYDLYQKGVDSALDLGLLDLLGENGIHFVEWGDSQLFGILKNAFENIFIIQITKAKNDRIYEFKSEF